MIVLSKTANDYAKYGVDLSKADIFSSQIDDYIDMLSAEPLRQLGAKASPSNKPLEERLFDTLASFKVTTSSVSMHLKREWQKRLFTQLDSLLDYEEWEELDEPPTEGSFRTFLRMLLLLSPNRRPALGSSGDGQIIAAWTNERNRLTVECMSGDDVRWVLTRVVDGQIERAAGDNQIERLPAVLAPYGPEIWFDYA